MLTRSTRISLDETFLRTSLAELGGEPCELWQNFVDDAQVRGEVVLVNVKGEEAAYVAETSNDQDRRLVVGHDCRIYAYCSRGMAVNTATKFAE